MKNSSFHIRWGSLALGIIFGLFSMLVVLFSRSERRDRFYSSLLGIVIGMAINLFLLRYAANHGLIQGLK